MEALRKASHSSPAHKQGQLARRIKTRTRRKAYQDQGRKDARNSNALHLMGCMLYWAEGSKSPCTIGFANSDPEMILLFIKFLKECLDVEPCNIRISYNAYLNHGISKEQIDQYWLNLTGLESSNMNIPTINCQPKSSKSDMSIPGKYPYGIARISVVKTPGAIQRIYGAIQEYAGFDNHAWLD